MWLYQFTFQPTVHMFPFFPNTCQHLLFVVFLIITILTGVRLYLKVVLVCISLRIRFKFNDLRWLHLRLQSILSLFLNMVWEYILVSLFTCYIPICNTTYWRDCLFPIVYSCFFCHRLIDLISVDLVLSSLSYSIDLHVCFCASTILSLLLQLCSKGWNQGALYLQLYSSSRFFWLFKAFWVSTQILELFVPVLWKMAVVFW